MKTFKLTLFLFFVSTVILCPQNKLYIKPGATFTAQNSILLYNADRNNHGVFQGDSTMTANSIGDTFILNTSTINASSLTIAGTNVLNIQNGDIKISHDINMNSDGASLALENGNIILESTATINNENNSSPIVVILKLLNYIVLLQIPKYLAKLVSK